MKCPKYNFSCHTHICKSKIRITLTNYWKKSVVRYESEPKEHLKEA